LLSGFAPTLSLQASAKSVAVASSAADNTMTIEKMSVWIDPEYFVRRKMRMEGVIRRGGKVQDFFLEKEDKDYRTIPGSYLYKPYREEMRMGGMMSQKEQAEMQEAVRKLDDYEMQMASMPASQRAMMEKMMGSQVQQLRNMANGGAVELVLVTTSIVINPDLSSPPGPFGAIPPSSTMDENLVKIVQQHLQSLGYQPGDTNGELDKLTVVAISKFQADNDMEVTGQATPQLAGILAAAVDARN
jgi:hypothetical protein